MQQLMLERLEVKRKCSETESNSNSSTNGPNAEKSKSFSEKWKKDRIVWHDSWYKIFLSLNEKRRKDKNVWHDSWYRTFLKHLNEKPRKETYVWHDAWYRAFPWIKKVYDSTSESKIRAVCKWCRKAKHFNYKSSMATTGSPRILWSTFSKHETSIQHLAAAAHNARQQKTNIQHVVKTTAAREYDGDTECDVSKAAQMNTMYYVTKEGQPLNQYNKVLKQQVQITEKELNIFQSIIIILLSNLPSDVGLPVEIILECILVLFPMYHNYQKCNKEFLRNAFKTWTDAGLFEIIISNNNKGDDALLYKLKSSIGEFALNSAQNDLISKNISLEDILAPAYQDNSKAIFLGKFPELITKLGPLKLRKRGVVESIMKRMEKSKENHCDTKALSEGGLNRKISGIGECSPKIIPQKLDAQRKTPGTNYCVPWNMASNCGGIRKEDIPVSESSSEKIVSDNSAFNERHSEGSLKEQKCRNSKTQKLEVTSKSLTRELMQFRLNNYVLKKKTSATVANHSSSSSNNNNNNKEELISGSNKNLSSHNSNCSLNSNCKFTELCTNKDSSPGSSNNNNNNKKLISGSNKDLPTNNSNCSLNSNCKFTELRKDLSSTVPIQNVRLDKVNRISISKKTETRETLEITSKKSTNSRKHPKMSADPSTELTNLQSSMSSDDCIVHKNASEAFETRARYKSEFARYFGITLLPKGEKSTDNCDKISSKSECSITSKEENSENEVVLRDYSNSNSNEHNDSNSEFGYQNTTTCKKTENTNYLDIDKINSKTIDNKQFFRNSEYSKPQCELNSKNEEGTVYCNTGKPFVTIPIIDITNDDDDDDGKRKIVLQQTSAKRLKLSHSVSVESRPQREVVTDLNSPHTHSNIEGKSSVTSQHTTAVLSPTQQRSTSVVSTEKSVSADDGIEFPVKITFLKPSPKNPDSLVTEPFQSADLIAVTPKSSSVLSSVPCSFTSDAGNSSPPVYTSSNDVSEATQSFKDQNVKFINLLSLSATRENTDNSPIKPQMFKYPLKSVSLVQNTVPEENKERELSQGSSTRFQRNSEKRKCTIGIENGMFKLQENGNPKVSMVPIIKLLVSTGNENTFSKKIPIRTSRSQKSSSSPSSLNETLLDVPSVKQSEGEDFSLGSSPLHHQEEETSGIFKITKVWSKAQSAFDSVDEDKMLLRSDIFNTEELIGFKTFKEFTQPFEGVRIAQPLFIKGFISNPANPVQHGPLIDSFNYAVQSRTAEPESISEGNHSLVGKESVLSEIRDGIHRSSSEASSTNDGYRPQSVDASSTDIITVAKTLSDNEKGLDYSKDYVSAKSVSQGEGCIVNRKTYLSSCVKNWTKIFPWMLLDYCTLSISCSTCETSVPIYKLQHPKDTLVISSKLRMHSELDSHIAKVIIKDRSLFTFVYENLYMFYSKTSSFHDLYNVKFNDSKMGFNLKVTVHKALVKSLADVVNMKVLSNLQGRKFSCFVDAERGVLIVRYISGLDQVEENLLLPYMREKGQTPEEYFISKGIDIERALISSSKSSVKTAAFPLAFPTLKVMLNRISSCKSYKTYSHLLSNLSALYFYRKDMFCNLPNANILFNARFEDSRVLQFIDDHLVSLNKICQEIYKSDQITEAFEAQAASTSFRVTSQLRKNAKLLSQIIADLTALLDSGDESHLKEVANQWEKCVRFQMIECITPDNENRMEFLHILLIYLQEIQRDIYYEGKSNMALFLDLFSPEKLRKLNERKLIKMTKLFDICKGVGTPYEVLSSLKAFSETLVNITTEKDDELPIWFKIMEEFKNDDELKKQFEIPYEIYRTLGLLSIEPTYPILFDFLCSHEKYLSDNIPHDIILELLYVKNSGPGRMCDEVWQYFGL